MKFWALVGLLVVLVIIGQSGKNRAPSVSTIDTPNYSPPVEQQAPVRPQELMPPVGRDLVFSVAQIRYCLAEDIRMEGAKSAIDNQIQSDVARFNAMVADYNSRCGSFSYSSGALESARRDIEPYRGQLQAEGASRFAPSPTGSVPRPWRSRAEKAVIIKAVQQRLNELGYEAGTPDGQMGTETRLGIIAFQHDNGMDATGEVDQALLQSLQLDSSGSSIGSESRDPVIQNAPAATASLPSTTPPPPIEERPALPDNARVVGSSWICNTGFRRTGNECEAIVLPDNALYVGSGWICMTGFRRVDDQCVSDLQR
jgi:hypothetical protein